MIAFTVAATASASSQAVKPGGSNAAANSLDGVKSIDTTLEIRSAVKIKDNGQVPAVGTDNVLTGSVMMQTPGKNFQSHSW